MSLNPPLQRDANWRTVQSNEAYMVKKTVTFAAVAGQGAVGTVAVFNVTGDVLLNVFATCSSDLTSAGAATVEVGLAGNTAGLIAQTTATAIDTGEVWTDATPTTIEALPTSPRIIAAGADVIITVGTADVSGGVLSFYCLYRPLSDGASVVAA